MIVSDIFDKGGIIVWILAAYAFIALTIVLERMIRFTFMDKPKKISKLFCSMLFVLASLIKLLHQSVWT